MKIQYKNITVTINEKEPLKKGYLIDLLSKLSNDSEKEVTDFLEKIKIYAPVQKPSSKEPKREE